MQGPDIWTSPTLRAYNEQRKQVNNIPRVPDQTTSSVTWGLVAVSAQVEEHMVDGQRMRLLVHRKGSTRAFPPHHPLIPVDYQLTGQPVLIGGTMGTHSYVLTGTDAGMAETFGSTCHGAGRATSRNSSRRNLDYQQVLWPSLLVLCSIAPPFPIIRLLELNERRLCPQIAYLAYLSYLTLHRLFCYSTTGGMCVVKML